MIRKAVLSDAKDISRLMINDLANPNPNFPSEMIVKFREHAQIEEVEKEFKNPNLIALVFRKSGKTTGFVVGYKEDKKAFLHYVTGYTKNIRLILIKTFEKECLKLRLDEIKTDTFEFMENKNIFELAGFEFFKAENLTPKLKILWYKKRLLLLPRRKLEN